MITIAKAGRKPKYTEWLTKEGLDKIRAFRRKGLTEKQIADEVIHVNTATIYDWKSKFPEFSEALKDGDEVALAQVENKLFEAAVNGFVTVEETKEEKDGKIYRKIVKKKNPPSVPAMIFYLKNRGNGKWRDNPVEETTDTDIRITLDWGGGTDEDKSKKKHK